MKKVSLEKASRIPRWGYVLGAIIAFVVVIAGTAFVSYQAGSTTIVFNVTETPVAANSSASTLVDGAPSPSVGFSDMTAEYEKVTSNAENLKAAVQALIDHPVENPRVQTVADWQWVDILGLDNESTLFSDENHCGIEMGGKLTEIGTLGNRVLVRYALPDGVYEAPGTPCDGGEVFFMDE